MAPAPRCDAHATDTLAGDPAGRHGRDPAPQGVMGTTSFASSRSNAVACPGPRANHTREVNSTLQQVQLRGRPTNRRL